MSKFLKFIVHFVVICTILCVVALAVPPFFGVTTEIRDDSTIESNLAMGSVTYAIPVKTEEAALGTPILVNDEDTAVSQQKKIHIDLFPAITYYKYRSPHLLGNAERGGEYFL